MAPLRRGFSFGDHMRFEKVGADGHVWKIVGDDDEATVLYRKNDSGSFVEAFRVGEGYIALKNTATGSLPSAPAEGALVYDSTTNTPKFHNGSSWSSMAGHDSGQDLVLDAGQGVDFSDNTGTSANGAATTSEKLTHFEQGTWQPAIWDASYSNAESQTYSTQTGLFIRIGPIVFIQGRIVMNDPGTLTTSQTAWIGDLPYAASASSTSAIAVSEAAVNVGTAGYNIGGYVEPGANRVRLRVWDDTGGETNLTIAELGTTSGAITFSGFYFV